MKNISKLLLVACFAMNVSYVQSSMPNQYTGSMPGQYTAGMPYIPLSPLPPMTLSDAQAYYNMLLSSYYHAQAANDMVALAQIAADLTVITIFLDTSTPAPANYAPVDQPVAPTAVYQPTQITTGLMNFVNKTPNQTVILTFSDGRTSYTIYPSTINMPVPFTPRSASTLNPYRSLKVTATDVSGTYKRSNPTLIQQKTDNVAGVTKYVTVTTDGKKLVVTVS